VRHALCAALLSAALPVVSAAEDLALPAEVEAKLSASVAGYERTMAARASDRVVIAIITNPSDRDSTRAALQLQQGFSEVDRIGKLPHEEFILPWTGGVALTEACVRRKVNIVFISTGLDHAIEPVVKTLERLGVLTIAGSLPYVMKGVVLGFDLVSGRPKVVINLTMAKKQGLEFRADLLRLARVVE
jgi:YfiR/HmsC-like